MQQTPLGVSQAWFDKWRRGDPSPQHARREQLGVAIRRLFAKHRGTYGSPRITADLRGEGWQVGPNTVAALMHEMGLAARRRRRKQTTRPGCRCILARPGSWLHRRGRHGSVRYAMIPSTSSPDGFAR
jgi:transposase InsO family protein